MVIKTRLLYIGKTKQFTEGTKLEITWADEI